MLGHPKDDQTTQVKLDRIVVGNQHGTPNLAELGWLAGILEGEGSISLVVRKKSWNGWQGVGVDLNVSFVNTDGFIIEKVVSLLRQIIGSEPHVQGHAPSRIHKADGTYYQNVGKTVLYVGVSKMAKIKMLLEALIPHMVGEKSARARLMIDFITRRQGKNGERTKTGASWYGPFDWALVKQFYDLKGKPLPPEVRGLVNDQEQSEPQIAA